MDAPAKATDRLEPAALHTAFGDLIGIRYPIVKAGTGGGTGTPELVAAVSEAGGLGLLEGSQGRGLPQGRRYPRLGDAGVLRRTRVLVGK